MMNQDPYQYPAPYQYPPSQYPPVPYQYPPPQYPPVPYQYPPTQYPPVPYQDPYQYPPVPYQYPPTQYPQSYQPPQPPVHIYVQGGGGSSNPVADFVLSLVVTLGILLLLVAAAGMV